MPSIDNRISKLEQIVRSPGDQRTKEQRDADVAAALASFLPIAALCNSPDELADHMKSREPALGEQVVSLEARQKDEAVRRFLARTIWEEARS